VTKKFIKNLAFVLFINLLIKPFWILGIDRTVQNTLGAEEYGFYYAILNFTFLFNILLDFGITNFNNRNIAQNNQLLRKHLSHIIVLKLVLAVTYVLISVIVALIIHYSLKHILLLLVLCFNQFLLSFILYLRSNLSGLHLFKIDSVISVLDRFIIIVFCSVMLWGPFPFKITISWYVFAQTFAYFVTAIIAMTIVYRKAKTKFFRINWNLPFSMMIVKKSAPFAVLILLMSFYNRIDTVMMERLLPDGAFQAGIYASAYRLLDATNMIAFLVSGLLLPIFAKMIKLKDSVEELSKLAFTILFIPAVIIAFGSIFYSHEIMKLLYWNHVEASARIFGILMACFIPICTTYIFGTLLTANGNLKSLNLMASCGMVMNIGLNLYLIPHYQAVGAAAASLVTQLFTSLLQVFIAKKQFHFKINYKLLTKTAIFVLGVILINFLLKQNIVYNWKMNLVIMAIISTALAFALKLINLKNLWVIMKYGEGR
jgi:O-antigen/teichoic acid export membrane protein